MSVFSSIHNWFGNILESHVTFMSMFCLTGKGCVYSFDPIGSYEREVFRAAGSGGSILQPLLDNQVLFFRQFILYMLPKVAFLHGYCLEAAEMLGM